MIKSQKGQATVELALSLIILFMLIFGMIDFGRIFHAYITLDHAGHEGARVASLGAADNEVRNRVKDAAPSLHINDKDIVVTPTEGQRTTGSDVTINISYSVPLSIPLFKEFLPDPFVIHNKTVMRVE